MNIALLEPLGVSRELIDQLSAPIRASGHEFVYFEQKTTDPQELAKRSENCEVVMIANNPYPVQAVEQAKELRLIDVAFTGIDHVALDACRERNIQICNAANYSNQTVAEMVIGMTIALLRKFPEADKAVRNQKTAAGLTGREIAGRTVGIVGTGRIGMITAKLFLAFGAKVIACDPCPNPEAEKMGITYMPLKQLMEQSDIVTIHTPNTPETRGMIDRECFYSMKKNAYFINCARGPIIDNQALTDALNEERISGAGIDVYNVEPPIPADEPLLHAKHTVLTPHTAFLSEESMIRRAHIAFENVQAYLNGEPQNLCKF